MARKLRWAAIGLAVFTAGLIVALWIAYRAVCHVRPFYQQALELDPQMLEAGRRELESRATALYSDAQQAGQWQAVFTDRQINGWLAVQLAENHADELPEEVREPRVAISPQAVSLGFKTSLLGADTVVSVDADVFLTDENAVAIRLMSVRAGSLPLPVMQVADDVAGACRDLSLPVRWTRSEGRPVAVIDLHGKLTSGEASVVVDAIELHEGELYVAGHTDAAGSEISISQSDLEDMAR